MITQEHHFIAGTVALVTGAARGIGAQISRELSRLGVTVACADLLDTGLPDGMHNSGHSFHSVDVRSEDSVDRMIKEVVDTHGRIDYLVNNAGIVRRGPATHMSLADFNEVLSVNLTGSFIVSQAAYPYLKKSRGSVVNIGSTAGERPVKGTVGYCVSKAGVMHLARVLALEWASDGIRVNSVGPTIVPTDMTFDVRADDSYMASKLSTIPIGRMATEQDVALAVTFLLNPASGMITGQTIFVDGGVLTQ